MIHNSGVKVKKIIELRNGRIKAIGISVGVYKHYLTTTYILAAYGKVSTQVSVLGTEYLPYIV